MFAHAPWLLANALIERSDCNKSYRDQTSPADRAMARLTSRPKDAVEHAPVIHARNAAQLVRQEWLDGRPFIVGEFVAYDSRPVVTDANTLTSLPLSGAQPTWQDMRSRVPVENDLYATSSANFGATL
jgi:hypothetical protein